jgi:meiotically up-regulated gene 157 (Mug157) protein
MRVACVALIFALCAPVWAGAMVLSSGGMQGVPVMVPPVTLFHTLASDFHVQRDGTIYVQTGDIPAMWLRDAAAQTLPYIRLARTRPMLRNWIRAVIAREARNIEIDPYANAFKKNYQVWERKWEVDSLAYPMILAWTYEAADGDRRIFTPRLHRAMARIVATYDCERDHARCSHYRFPPRQGGYDRGPARPVGLIWTAFRASDDPTRFAYNIPEEMLASTALSDIADLALRGYADRALAVRAGEIAAGIDLAVARYGVVDDSACGGRVYAYEVDALGHRVFFDDANIPSLLAAPLDGYTSVDDPLYHRTRECVLSRHNRYYFAGRYAAGIGSPHTPHGYVWPLAMIARALTSTNRAEVLRQLRALAASASSGGLIHESFDPSDPQRFTRAEFGWANAMYAELLFRAAADFPAQRISVRAPASGRRVVAESIAVVDPVTARANRRYLISSFERAIPLEVVGPEDALDGSTGAKANQCRGHCRHSGHSHGDAGDVSFLVRIRCEARVCDTL